MSPTTGPYAGSPAAPETSDQAELTRLRGQLAAARAKCREVARRGFDSMGLREVEAALTDTPETRGSASPLSEVVEIRAEDVKRWQAMERRARDAARTVVRRTNYTTGFQHAARYILDEEAAS